MTLDLTHPAEQIATLVAGVTDDQLDAPTPCPEMDGAARCWPISPRWRRRSPMRPRRWSGPTTSTPPDRGRARAARRLADGDPGRLTALVAAWQRPGGLAGRGAPRSASRCRPTDIGYVANNELVLHGWDLSAATDQPFEVAEPNLDASWVMVFNTPDDPAAREGLFGPRLPVAECLRCWTGSWPAPDAIRTGRRRPDSSPSAPLSTSDVGFAPKP